MRWFRELRRRFYAGPRDLGFHLRRHGGYQSPTLTSLVWLYALAVRHLTLPGRIVLICFVLIGPYSVTTPALPAHFLALGVISLFAVDIVMGWILRPRLQVERVLPPRMAAGSEATVSYRLVQKGRLPCWDIEVDTLPLPHALEFHQGRWGVSELRRGATETGAARLRAVCRGEFSVPAARVSSGFPFHLFRFGATGGRPQTMVIYPTFTPLLRIDFPSGIRHHAEGAPRSSVAGASLEFLGCREFREGDNLRHLHMRSWARTGTPVVKEFREEYFCRMGLVLDTVLERHPFEEMRKRFSPRIEFESMVSLAAATADHFAAHDYAVDLFAAGSRVYRFAGSRSLSVQDRILEILACQDYTTHDNTFGKLKTALLGEPANMSGILFILNLWNRPRKDLVEELLSRGIPCKVIIVHFRHALPDRRDLPSYVTPVTAESIRDGHCRHI